MTKSDFVKSRVNRSRTANSSWPPPPTSAADSNVQPPRNTERPEEPLLLGRELLVTPLNRGVERLVPCGSVRCPGAEKLESPIQLAPDLLDGEDGHARCGELDRKRDSVQAPADLGHGGRIPVRGSNAGFARLARSRNRRTDSIAASDRAGMASSAPGVMSGGTAKDHRTPAGLRARGENGDARARVQEGARDLGARFHLVFAVVEDDQDGLFGRGPRRRFERRRARFSRTPAAAATAWATLRFLVRREIHEQTPSG